MTKGTRIKRRREELGIGQTDLAKKVGISKQSLYKYEKDIITNIPTDVVERLASALDTTPAFIMGWEGKNNITLEFEQYFQDSGRASRIATYVNAFAKLSKKSQDNVIDYMNYQIKKESEDESH